MSDQIAVMTGKDVMILSVVKSEEERRASQMKQGRKKAVKDLTDLTFLPREQVSEKTVHNEFVISQVRWVHPRHDENLHGPISLGGGGRGGGYAWSQVPSGGLDMSMGEGVPGGGCTREVGVSIPEGVGYTQGICQGRWVCARGGYVQGSGWVCLPTPHPWTWDLGYPLSHPQY